MKTTAKVVKIDWAFAKKEVGKSYDIKPMKTVYKVNNIDWSFKTDKGE